MNTANKVGGSTAKTELASIVAPSNRVAHITVMERVERLRRLRERMMESGCGAVILTPGANLRYFSGVPWIASERFVGLIVMQDQLVAICPKFEDSALHSVLRIKADVQYWEEDESPHSLVAGILAKFGVNSAAIDPNCFSGQYLQIADAASGIALTSAETLIAPLRARKSDAEIALMLEAKKMTLEVHRLASCILREGIKVSEVTAFIDNAHRVMGADNGSTFCAVQFGEGTSHPHGVPGDSVLQDGDLVLIDTGCTVDGYHSDITRCYAFGTPDPDVQRIWEIEKEAQLATFSAARPGVRCGDLDLAARKVIESHGMGPGYSLPGLPHRTGHGIGLEIHEGPYLMRADDTPLASGMCFSNEPMIVVPGQFGVRLEDHFYMTQEKPVWFTEPQWSYTEPFGDDG